MLAIQGVSERQRSLGTVPGSCIPCANSGHFYSVILTTTDWMTYRENVVCNVKLYMKGRNIASRISRRFGAIAGEEPDGQRLLGFS